MSALFLKDAGYFRFLQSEFQDKKRTAFIRGNKTPVLQKSYCQYKIEFLQEYDIGLIIIVDLLAKMNKMSTFLSFSTVYSRLLYRVERSTIKRRCQIQESHFRRSLFSCFVSLFLDSSFFFIFLPFTASFLPRISSFKLNKGATSPIIHSKLNNITLSKYFSNYHFLSSLSSLKKSP